MATPGNEPPDELSPRERARLRHRDRKRTTVMVVDNAGVKRMALALSRRRSSTGAPDTARPSRSDDPGAQG